ncbi:MAG: hypothetical protein Q4B31_04305 [Clostridia bacterium]|nr:hypothetical protein [Clostridia bacterium]
MKGLSKVTEKKYGELVLGLISGFGYFGIVFRFILDNTKTGGLLLALMFAPLIICLPAILVIKGLRLLREREQFIAHEAVVWIHMFLFVTSVVTLLETFIH